MMVKVRRVQGEYLQRRSDGKNAVQQGGVIYNQGSVKSGDIRSNLSLELPNKYLGRHLIIEVYGCSFEKLNDAEKLRKVMISAAKRAGATILGDFFHKFNPHGVSGIVVIAESHISIHTWPEYGYAAIDIYTCGDIDVELIKRELLSFLQPAFFMDIELKRGLPLTEVNQSRD